ncbi:maltase 2 [Nilaparvata lugens]|uniref:maltase 2 n=1 Tax=Nilaparvata lugens TaxID=108931 RepID=UPI00193CF4BC|nr:maltase 2 [Nilaparvata lugens]
MKGLVVVFGVFLALNFENEVSAGWKGWKGEIDWWQNTIIYQIYPRSFQDSNGDGIGDLKGIESRLDHLKDTDIGTFWMSPIFKSPMADLGYDIANYTNVDPIFGTIQDFKDLMRKAKKKGLKVLNDFVPNHSSDECEWFKKSIKRIEPYTNYYIWKDAKLVDGNRTVPNNWQNLFGTGSAWEWNEERGQYYYHNFHKKQPDLNYRNETVIAAMEEVMKFWLDLGVDGFRMDALKYMVEDKDFRDEIMIDEDGPVTYDNMYHNMTSELPETIAIIKRWRKFIENYRLNAEEKHTRLMLAEVYADIDHTMSYYGTNEEPVAHMPFNFFPITDLTFASNASAFEAVIKKWIDNMPDGCWPNWVIGNHDNYRVATRMGEEMVDMMAMFTMLLPGTVITYQGEEVGQTNTLVRPDQFVDPNNNGPGSEINRDPQRGPFLWDSSDNAGFTKQKKPWQPINPNFWTTNLKAQTEAKYSHYQVYRKLAKLRHHPTIQRGSLETHVISPWVFSFVRRLKGEDTIIVVLNLGSEGETVAVGETIRDLPDTLSIMVPSVNSIPETGVKINSRADRNKPAHLLLLRPKSAVVLTDGEVKEDDENSQSRTKNSASSSQKSLPLIILATLSIFASMAICVSKNL